ncbi:hypothetical protein [Nocardioides bruguierae]|uniref:Uncharacterized protein n=1 Tax=Nocardioides bruguierae TaxID=2945102 RepID=A0A9X2DC09_9ACTN|nr:hypothetical protein [Nocardioides bruguierae]MCM0622834.1 hypothetical protein [Nocardioides bruguierae]
MTRTLYIDGYPLDLIGPAGPARVLTRWGDGGCGTYEITWDMALPYGTRSHRLHRSALVEIRDAGVTVESGILTEPDWKTGSFTAKGLARAAEDYKAMGELGGELVPTTSANGAINKAIARGLPWTLDITVKTGAYGEVVYNDSVNQLDALLDAVADEAGKRWGVHPDGRVLFEADPTTADLRVGPGVVDYGTTDDEWASSILIRYYDSGSSQLETAIVDDDDAIADWGRVELDVDATQLGSITAPTATAIANGILAKGRARLTWSGAIEVAYGEITTLGLQPVDLSSIRAGMVLRAPVPLDDARRLNGRLTRDLVIGRTDYTEGSQSISLSPVDADNRSLADIVEDTLTRAANSRLRFRK